VELAIGGQSISKAEFDRLVALNSPSKSMVSGWNCVARHQNSASVFAARKDKLALSLEDALRLHGDTQSIEKTVVSFEASGHSGVDCDANE